MAGIWIAAIVVSVASLALIGSVLLWRSPRVEWGWLTLAVVLQLPMSALVFHDVRMPLDDWLRETLGPGSEAYLFLRNFSAPVTEELAKLWPLLVVGFRRRINGYNAVRVGVALGLGFGVGEAWLIASLLANRPFTLTLPWHQLGGFMGERFLVCVHHGVFTATALWWWQRRGSLVRGVLAAMGLHLLGNAPLYLAARNAGGLGREVWRVIISLWLVGFFFGMLGLLSYYIFGRLQLGRLLFGQARCPECGNVYVRSMWALNLLTHRLERCPHCGRWHLTKRLPEDPC